jgi:hypothetical protein
MTTAALIRLLTRPKVPMSMRLGPEDREAIAFADALRAASLDGRLKGVWTKTTPEGKRHRLTALLLRAEGMHTGVADFVFTWPNGGGWIELKTGRNKPTPAQLDFQSWCGLTGVRHAVVWSADEGLAVLTGWDALLPERPARTVRAAVLAEAVS